MVAANREDAPAAQEIEIAGAILVEQIGTDAAAEAYIEANGPQDPHQHVVEVARVQVIALGLALFQQSCEIERASQATARDILRRQIRHLTRSLGRPRVSNIDAGPG
jgi:hypothetical protein